jgi:hypothetical protein
LIACLSYFSMYEELFHPLGVGYEAVYQLRVLCRNKQACRRCCFLNVWYVSGKRTRVPARTNIVRDRIFSVSKRVRVTIKGKMTVLFKKGTEIHTFLALIARKCAISKVSMSVLNLCSLKDLSCCREPVLQNLTVHRLGYSCTRNTDPQGVYSRRMPVWQVARDTQSSLQYPSCKSCKRTRYV